jgi:hypothetical protein
MGKRMAGVIATAGIFVVTTTGLALAQTSYPPTPSATTSVAGVSGGSGGNDGGTAFTGGRIGFAVVAIVVLLALGLAASVVARRRSARVAG